MSRPNIRQDEKHDPHPPVRAVRRRIRNSIGVAVLGVTINHELMFEDHIIDEN